MRRKADAQALRMKELLIAGTRDLEKLPPHLLHILRGSVRMGAIAFGHLAHWIGERSHELADLVSHKHRFERRPPRSEFLKQVNEHSMRSRLNGSAQHAKPASFESMRMPPAFSGAPSTQIPMKQENVLPKKKRKIKPSNEIAGKEEMNANRTDLDR